MLGTKQGRQMQSTDVRIKVRENSKLWGTTGTGNIWEKIKWPGHTGGQTKCKTYKGFS